MNPIKTSVTLPASIKVKPSITIRMAVAVDLKRPEKKEIGFHQDTASQKKPVELLEDFSKRLNTLIEDFGDIVIGVECEGME